MSHNSISFWINATLDLTHWKRPDIVHAGKPWIQNWFGPPFWPVVEKINAHSDLWLFLQVTCILTDLICTDGTRERDLDLSPSNGKSSHLKTFHSHFVPAGIDWPWSFRLYVIATPPFKEPISLCCYCRSFENIAQGSLIILQIDSFF